MANITGVNPPVLNDQNYVQKIIDSFTAVDNHDHTLGKGLPITTLGIADGSITAAKLATDSVTTIKIVDLNVTTAKLADDAVTTAKILDSNVTTAKLADSSVTNVKLASDAVTDVKVAAAAAIARSKLASGTAYRVLANNSSGVMSENAALTTGHVIIADANGQLVGEAALSLSRGGNGISNVESTDSSTTGAIASVPTITGHVRLTNASLTSVAMIAAASAGTKITVTNDTGAAIGILNDNGGTATDRILTGTGNDLSLDTNASIQLVYSSAMSRWLIVGGSGSGGGSSFDISARGVQTVNQFITDTQLIFDTTQFDTSTAISNPATAWQYTIPSSGKYFISSMISSDSIVWSTTEYLLLNLFKNGSKIAELGVAVVENTGTFTVSVNGGTLFDAASGDIIHLTGTAARPVNGGGITLTASGDYNWVSIHKISATTSSVAGDILAVANSSSGQSVGSGVDTIINFDTVETDSESAISTGASWKFTAPESRTYLVSTAVVSGNIGWNQGEQFTGYFYVNGVAYSDLGLNIAQATATYRLSAGGTKSIYLTAGDELDLRIRTSQTHNIFGSADSVWISIFAPRASGGGGGGGSGWELTGNAGTTDATDFIGTTDAQGFRIKTNSTNEQAYFAASGGLRLGDDTSIDTSLAPGFNLITTAQAAHYIYMGANNPGPCLGIAAVFAGDLLGAVPNLNNISIGVNSLDTSSGYGEIRNIGGALDINAGGGNLTLICNGATTNRVALGPTCALKLSIRDHADDAVPIYNWAESNIKTHTLMANTAATFSNTIDGEEITAIISNTSGSSWTYDIPNTVKGYTGAGFPITVNNGKYLTVKLIGSGGNIYISGIAGPY